MMTVSELIAQLQKLPVDARVILQKDAEGNGYMQTYGAELGYTNEPDSWEPENAYSEEALEEMIEETAGSPWAVNRGNYTQIVVIY